MLNARAERIFPVHRVIKASLEKTETVFGGAELHCVTIAHDNQNDCLKFDVYVKVNIMNACIAAILDNWTHMRQSLTLREGKTNMGKPICTKAVYRRSR